jgi:hypothetical protein
MLSANASLTEFVDRIAEQAYDDIILLTDQEATAAERRCCKQRGASQQDPEGQLETYALLLKDFLIYMRHGVITSALRSANCESLANLPRG